MKKLKFKNNKFNISTILVLCLFIVLFLYALILCASLGWGIMTTFKTKSDYFINRLGFPEKWVFDSYLNSFKYLYMDKPTSTGTRSAGILEMYGWSVLYAAGGALVQTGVTCIVAYVTAKFPCKFSSIIYGFVVFTMSLHIVGSLPSELQVAHALGLYDSMLGMYFMKAHFLSAYFLVFFAAFKSLPSSYFEAAEIDGGGHWSVLFRIALPLIRNIFITIFLLFAISYWNDYQTPMMFLPSYPTIAYGIYRFSLKSQGPMSNVPSKLAGCMFLLIPMLILFVAFNKFLLNSISIGGLKE